MIPAAKIVIPDADRLDILIKIDGVLKSGQLSGGPYVDEFEEMFKEYNGAEHVLALNSGGAALEAIFRSLKLEEGDEVIVPTNTFYASASAIQAAGGTVVLCDIDPVTMSPTLSQIQKKITDRTVGVVVVHIGGVMSYELPEIVFQLDQKSIWVVEDCAHALGSALEDGDGWRHAGTFGIAGAFSFFPTKVITSIEGGMVVTNDDRIADQVAVMRDYGKPEKFTSFHTQWGTNWRMHEIEAIVGLSQMVRLNDILVARCKVARSYMAYLNGEYPYRDDVLFSAPVTALGNSGPGGFYKFVVMLPEGVDRDAIKQGMRDRGASPSGGVYDIPLHHQPVFEGRYPDEDFPGATDFCERHLCLPLWPGMTAGEVTTVVRALDEAVNEAVGS